MTSVGKGMQKQLCSASWSMHHWLSYLGTGLSHFDEVALHLVHGLVQNFLGVLNAANCAACLSQHEAAPAAQSRQQRSSTLT